MRWTRAGLRKACSLHPQPQEQSRQGSGVGHLALEDRGQAQESTAQTQGHQAGFWDRSSQSLHSQKPGPRKKATDVRWQSLGISPETQNPR